MIKVQKDKVIKEVQDNVLSDYLRLGWVVIKDDKKENKPKESSFTETANNKL